MVAERRKYRTRQRELVEERLAGCGGVYVTVDDVLSAIKADGGSIGRTTVYRTLEDMVEDGRAIKVSVPGKEASYRIANDKSAGQLVCLQCGRVYPLDCHTATDLACHVLDHHGFYADSSRTVMYGKCAACMEACDGR